MFSLSHPTTSNIETLAKMKSYSTVVLLVTVMVANAYCMHSRNEDIPDSELLMEKALSLLEGEKTMAEVSDSVLANSSKY